MPISKCVSIDFYRALRDTPASRLLPVTFRPRTEPQFRQHIERLHANGDLNQVRDQERTLAGQNTGEHAYLAEQAARVRDYRANFGEAIGRRTSTAGIMPILRPMSGGQPPYRVSAHENTLSANSTALSASSTKKSDAIL